MFCTKRWFIYVLKEPITGDVRYVGKTTNPRARYTKHLSESRRRKYHCPYWIASLLRRGLEPVMAIIDAGMGNGWGAAERAWIAEYKRRGARLTNVARGGGCGSGPLSDEAKAKIAASKRGKPRSAETRRKLSIARTGMRPSEETRRKMSKAHTGRKVSEATLAKLRARKQSPETRQKIREAHIGMRHTEETKRKMSVAKRGKQLSAEHKAEIAESMRVARASRFWSTKRAGWKEHEPTPNPKAQGHGHDGQA